MTIHLFGLPIGCKLLFPNFIFKEKLRSEYGKIWPSEFNEKVDRLVSMKIDCKPMLTMKKTNSNISKELTWTGDSILALLNWRDFTDLERASSDLTGCIRQIWTELEIRLALLNWRELRLRLYWTGESSDWGDWLYLMGFHKLNSEIKKLNNETYWL